MITNMIGVVAAGIYSVGSKLGHASQLIYSAFAGGWQYFAFSTMKDQDQVELTSDIFDYLCCLAMCSGIFISFFSEILFVPLFGEAYAEAKCVVQYLFMAPLVQMLYQVSMNISCNKENMAVLLPAAVRGSGEHPAECLAYSGYWN